MPAKGSEVVDVEVSVIAQTENAWKVQAWATNKTTWVPKSQAEIEWQGLTTKTAAVLTMPTWLAIEKELI